MLTDDKQLAILIKKGDKKAFKTLFELHYVSLIAFGNSLINDNEACRDLVQEVFLKLWEKRRSMSVHTSLKSYLFTAINNSALNFLRHEKIVSAFWKYSISSWIFEESIQLQVSPFVREAINKAIDSLPSKAKQCFTLTQIDGLSIREAAIKLDVAEKTVENQLARSRKILQQKLKKYKD